MRDLAKYFSLFLVGRGPDGVLPDLGLLGLRLGFGLTMALVHGRGTLAGFRSDPTGYPDPLGLGAELSMGLMVGAELFCALAVATGFLTRLTLVPLLFGLGTAFFVFHAGDPFAEKELAFLYLVAWVVLLLSGPGRFSLDRLLATRLGKCGSGVGGSLLLFLFFALASPVAATVQVEGDLSRKGDRPLEELPGLDSLYGVLGTSDGLRLRTILTRPAGSVGPLPAIAFVQWLSCDTVEIAPERTDGWSRMLRRIATESGMVMLRTEKAGVGDSEGPPCSEIGYDRELSHHRDALAGLLAHPWVDPERVVVFGASMGATMAPLVARGHDVAGVVVWGGGARTWLERTLGFERRFRELSGQPPEQLTAEMKLVSDFLPEYLIERRRPGEIAAAEPGLGAAWDLLVGTEGETHYGRSPAFHQEAQARDWASAWAELEAPVLALYGEYDWYEDEAGHRLIVELVERTEPGRARLAVVPATDHHFVRYPSPEAAVSGDGGSVDEGPAVDEILAFVSAVTADESATVPPSASATLASYRRAEELVRGALEALGGPGVLEEAGGVTLSGTGTLDLTTMMQGTHPERSDRVPVEEELAVDLIGDRVGYETHARVNPDADEWIRSVHDAEGRQLIVLRLASQAFWVPGDPDRRRRYERLVPHLLLREALERRHTLRRLGRSSDEEAVTFTLASGEAVTLLIDRSTGRLGGIEYLLDLPLLGDTPIRWELDPYREVEGLGPYPGGYRILRGDRLFKEVEYETIRAGVDDAGVFRSPDGIEIPEPPPTSTPEPSTPEPSTNGAGKAGLPEVRTVADSVHLALGVRAGFHVLFVELADSVLVVGTPAGYHELQMVPAVDWAGDVTSSSVGRRLLRAIEATVPDKPVRHVVLTHHHGDHAGGIRPFLAAGATVYASPPTARVVEEATRATFSLEPDELSGRDIPTKIEVVDGERTIFDGERTIRILDVGENPHAEGVLVVYLPEERILYQSDLFMPTGGDFPDPSRVPVMRWFVDWLDTSGLEPETILAIHGTARVTEKQLEAIRALEDS